MDQSLLATEPARPTEYGELVCFVLCKRVFCACV